MNFKGIHRILIYSFILLACNNQDEIVEPIQIRRGFGEFLDDWTFRAYPTDNFEIAEFKLWVPKIPDDLRAILILLHGNNSNAMGFVDKDEWKNFAKDEKIALVGVHFKGSLNFQYYKAGSGSGMILMKSIDAIANRNNLNEFSRLNYVIRGYSNGGVFAFHFAGFAPDKVIAFSNIRGGHMDELGMLNVNVPGLFIGGELDLFSKERIIKKVEEKRIERALWSYAIEPGAEHFSSTDKSDDLIRIFFSKAIQKRLSSENLILELKEEDGWLGSNVTNEIFNYSNENKEQTSWLIDSTFAKGWQMFQE